MRPMPVLLAACAACGCTAENPDFCSDALPCVRADLACVNHACLPPVWTAWTTPDFTLGSVWSDLGQIDQAQIQVDLAFSSDLAMAPAADMAKCVDTLAGVGIGDFTVAFSVTAKQGAPATLLTQRSACDNSEPFWYIGMEPNGTIYATAGVPYVGENATTPVNDGNLHAVALRRKGGTLTLEVDGKVEASAPSTAKLDALPALEIGQSFACNVRPTDIAVVSTVCLNAH